MKIIVSPLMGVCCAFGLLTGTSMANPDKEVDKGETMTKALCMACHGDTQAGQKRLAPPMMMVKSHYSALKKDGMVKAIVKWAKKPDAKHSRMPGAIRNFGLMPPLPLPDADLTAIATYISKTEFAMPKGCGPGPGAGAGAGKGKGAQAGCDPTKCDPTNCDPEKCGQGCGPGAGKGQGQGRGRGRGRGNGQGQGGQGRGQQSQ